MKLRETNCKRLQDEQFDVLIIGGGINGAVSAAALSRKGVRVALIDKQDFASETSSNSSNLAWGGIKYLESHEYFLVNDLCKSRNRLMRSYPSTVKEIRFLTTLQKGFRYPAWFIYLGTLLYWVMGRFFTQMPQYLTKSRIKSIESAINIDNAQDGFEYSDAFLHDNDARFVFNFIRSSLDSGAAVANYVQAIDAQKDADHWVTQVKDLQTENTFAVRSHVVINACGPYVDTFNAHIDIKTQHQHAFSKGVHLIVNKIPKVNKVLAFFASDGRLFFVIPMGQKTCIGTTDTRVDSPKTQVTEDDRQFILSNANGLLDLEQPLTQADVISERCGVRPLALDKQQGEGDWLQLSRKHAVDIDSQQKFISIFGGKLTDCINVGDEICDIVASLGVNIPFRDSIWYGESDDVVKQEFLYRAKLINLDAMTPEYSSEPLTQRLWRRYDMHALQILDEIQRDPTQAEQLMKNAEYLRAELHYAARREMITELDDFLRRRSKIAMVLRRDEILASPGLVEACEILFGDEAEEKLAEYRSLTEPTLRCA